MPPKLSHIDERGRPRMVDVSAKAATARVAVARGKVQFSVKAYKSVRAQKSAKGDVLRVAEIAGVMAAKKAAELIPLCHPLALSAIGVEATFDDDACAAQVHASVRSEGKTGVEMEALTAVAVACLTIYDMTKSIDKGMCIGGIELVEKTGGASGDFRKTV